MSIGPSTGSGIAQRALADNLTSPKGKPASRRSSGVAKIALLFVMLYLLIPLGATLWFGINTGIGFDFSSYQRIFSDPDFSQTFITSLELAAATTILAVVLVTPTAYWVQMRIPQARPLLDFLTLAPFAIPAIVLGVGLVQEYSGTANRLISVLSLGLVPALNNLNIVNTPPLLVCAYVIIALPFVYRPIDNSLRAINTSVLTEAAYSLGSGWWRTFLTVIMPNIWPGIISAALLTFSVVMGEFTIAQLFGVYTFPIFLNNVGQNDPHRAASLSILSFIITLVCVLGIILLVRRRPGGAEATAEIGAAK
jgi:putative spermidine/putrescine transport system permease protein